MLLARDIAALPSADEPALVLSDTERRAAVDRALARLSTMLWGPRVPVDEACATIREWIREHLP